MPVYYQGDYSIENKVFLLAIGPKFQKNTEDSIERGLEDIPVTINDIFDVSEIQNTKGFSLLKIKSKTLSHVCFLNCLSNSKTLKSLQVCIAKCIYEQ